MKFANASRLLATPFNLMIVVALGLLFVVRSILRIFDLLLTVLLIALSSQAPSDKTNNPPIAFIAFWVQRRVYQPVLESEYEVIITSAPKQPIGLLPRSAATAPRVSTTGLQRGCDPTNRIRPVAPTSEVLILGNPCYRPGIKLQQAVVPSPGATILPLWAPKPDAKIQVPTKPAHKELPLIIVQRSCRTTVKQFEIKPNSKTPQQQVEQANQVQRSLSTKTTKTKPSTKKVEATTPLLPEFPSLPSDIEKWSVRQLKAFCSKLRKTELERKGANPIKNYSQKTNQRWLVKLIKDYYKSHINVLIQTVV